MGPFDLNHFNNKMRHSKAFIFPSHIRAPNFCSADVQISPSVIEQKSPGVKAGANLKKAGKVSGPVARGLSQGGSVLVLGLGHFLAAECRCLPEVSGWIPACRALGAAAA